MELSAAAPICWPRADATAMAPATAAARRLRVGLGNLTDRDLDWTDRTSAAHLEGRLWPKQTTALIQGGRACRMDSPHPPMGGKKPGADRPDDRRCNDEWTRRANRSWVAVTKQTKTTREGPSAPGGLSGCRALRGLLLDAGLTGSGALDALLFGGTTAPDVGLHRRYNRSGGRHLQVPWRWDQFKARLLSRSYCGPIALAIVKMGWRK